MRGKEPLRFTDIQSATGLKATQVNRAMKTLVERHWVLAQTVPGLEYPIKVRYSLSKHGDAVARAVVTLRQEVLATPGQATRHAEPHHVHEA